MLNRRARSGGGGERERERGRREREPLVREAAWLKSVRALSVGSATGGEREREGEGEGEEEREGEGEEEREGEGEREGSVKRMVSMRIPRDFAPKTAFMKER